MSLAAVKCCLQQQISSTPKHCFLKKILLHNIKTSSVSIRSLSSLIVSSIHTHPVVHPSTGAGCVRWHKCLLAAQTTKAQGSRHWIMSESKPQANIKPKDADPKKNSFGSKDENAISKRFDFARKDDGIVMPVWGRVLAVFGAVWMAYKIYEETEEDKLIAAELFRYHEMNERTPMGGEWILLDEAGEETNSREFAGQWQLIYFGFSHCPDICPEEMFKLRAVVEALDADKDLPKVQPIFITLDPERDSPKVVKKYLEDFKIPRVRGFTAKTVAEIKAVCKMFHVYFGYGEVDEEGDYVVDHTIIIYLMNSQGKFVNYYSRALDAEPIVKSIKRHMTLWKVIEKKNKYFKQNI